jgi:hypothetical protein
MEKMEQATEVAPVPDDEVQPGKIRFHVVSTERASVSQLFVDRLRAIGADSEAVAFAERQVAAADPEASPPPDATA